MLSKFCIWRSKLGHIGEPDNSSQSRTVFVDVSVLAMEDAGTGIQRVVRAVYSHMQSMVPIGWRIIPVIATKRSEYKALPIDFAENPAQPYLEIAQSITPSAGDLFFGLDLAAHILPLRRRQVQYWRRRSIRCCFVVYDLLPHTNPEWFRPVAVRNFRKWLRFIVENGDMIIAISQHVRSQFLNYLRDERLQPLWIGQTAVVPLGWDIEASKPSTATDNSVSILIDRIRRGGRYILMVGTVEPRKAYDVALSAFEEIWADPASEYQLIIVGRPGWKTAGLQDRILRHQEAGSRLWWLQNVSDEDLRRLYGFTSGLLFASLAEGYGLPVGEALAQKRPILARDIPVLRELFGDAIQYFVSDEPVEFANRIIDWITSNPGPPPEGAAGLSTWEQSTRDFFTALGISVTTDED